MIHVPTAKPTKTQVLTTLAGVATAVLGYFFPALVPVLPALGKALWATGLFTTGVGLVQLPGKAAP